MKHKTKVYDYDHDHERETGGTETHKAVDDHMREVIEQGSSAGDKNAYHEGFASAHGVRPETSSSGGRIRYPEIQDNPDPDRVPDSIEKENPGLADN